MLNGILCLYAGAYARPGNYSRLLHFVQRFGPRLQKTPYDVAKTITELSNIRSELTQPQSGEVDAETALNQLLAADLLRIEQQLGEPSFQQLLGSEVPFEASLHSTLQRGVRGLSDLGLTVSSPEVFVVDTMPPPYEHMEYKAMAMDEENLEKHGIQPGLYFLRKHFRPFYSRALLLHELIHPVAARPDPFQLARGLEEGLAEVVGSLYLGGKILGPKLSTNLFVQSRLWFGFDQFWEQYVDHTRQAAWIYHRFGLDGLAALLEGGRAKIKEVEGLLLRGELSRVQLPAGRWEPELSDCLDVVTLTFSRNLVVSPLAKYLAPFIVTGRSIKDILDEARVSAHIGMKAINELQDRVVLSVSSDGQISSSDTSLVQDDGLLRYEIPQ